MCDDKTKDKNNEEKINDNLLSDDSWVGLISADYKAVGSPVDELSKERIWKSLAKRAWPKRISFKIRTFTAVAIIVVLGLPSLLMLNSKDSSVGIKGINEQFGQMQVYVLLANGNLIEKQKNAIGDTLVFKVKVFEPRLASLYYVMGDGQMKIAVEGQHIEADKETLFLKQGKVYGYQLEQGEAIQAFCSIFKSSLAEIKATFEKIRSQQVVSNASVCIKIGKLEK